MYLFSDFINTYRLVFSRRKYIWLLLVISTSVLLINLVLLIGVFLVRTQFLVDWKAPVSIGFLSRYVKVNQFTVDTNDLSIIWVISNKTVLFITLNFRRHVDFITFNRASLFGASLLFKGMQE